MVSFYLFLRLRKKNLFEGTLRIPSRAKHLFLYPFIPSQNAGIPCTLYPLFFRVLKQVKIRKHTSKSPFLCAFEGIFVPTAKGKRTNLVFKGYVQGKGHYLVKATLLFCEKSLYFFFFIKKNQGRE